MDTTLEATATSKGQIVIPVSVRRQFGISEGTKILVEVDEERHCIILRPITRDYIQALRGRLKGRGLVKALQAEKQREREL